MTKVRGLTEDTQKPGRVLTWTDRWSGLAGGFHDQLLFLSRTRPVSDAASYPTDAAV